MKVIMFSTEFPKGHPRAGDQTWFIEKINYGLKYLEQTGIQAPLWTPPKYHTIRAGNRWKVGETFSARFWMDKPYRSKQEEFAQLEIKKIWDIEFDMNGVPAIDGFYLTEEKDWELAMNDGLAYDDFCSWFPMDKPFKGQIICWNDKISY
jgi:hypothetical protein